VEAPARSWGGNLKIRKGKGPHILDAEASLSRVWWADSDGVRCDTSALARSLILLRAEKAKELNERRD
jgi:hypothetical protein